MTHPIFDPKTGEQIPHENPSPSAPSVMSLDEAKTLIALKHKVIINEDDPILMLVTLHQGFLQDYQRMLASHDGEIKRLLGETGQACAVAVDQVLQSLKDKTIKASLDHGFALVERQAVAMETLSRKMRRWAISFYVLTTMNLLAAGLTVFIITSISR